MDARTGASEPHRAGADDRIRSGGPVQLVRSPRRLVDETDLRVTSVHVEVLAKEIRDLLARQVAEGHCFIIFSVHDQHAAARNRYVQTITFEGDQLLAESVGERYADLGPAELRELELFGWFPPEGPVDPVGNFAVLWEPPDVDDTAQLLALTLVRIHGLRSPEDLTIRVTSTRDES